MIPVKGCPPSQDDIQAALKQAGIRVPNAFFKSLDRAPVFLFEKYKGKPEFEESFYQIA